jgi:hypothetical protein
MMTHFISNKRMCIGTLPFIVFRAVLSLRCAAGGIFAFHWEPVPAIGPVIAGWLKVPATNANLLKFYGDGAGSLMQVK